MIHIRTVKDCQFGEIKLGDFNLVVESLNLVLNTTCVFGYKYLATFKNEDVASYKVRLYGLLMNHFLHNRGFYDGDFLRWRSEP